MILHSILRHSLLKYLVDSRVQSTITVSTVVIQLVSQSTLVITVPVFPQQLQNVSSYVIAIAMTSQYVYSHPLGMSHYYLHRLYLLTIAMTAIYPLDWSLLRLPTSTTISLLQS